MLILKTKAEKLRFLAWLLSALVAVVALMAWGQGVHWQLTKLSTYELFPLFGLLAFSLIWSMYVAGFFGRRWNVESAQLGDYYKVLRAAVVALILLHPALLSWQLWRDGFGLPPGSIRQNYIAPALGWAVTLGFLSWLVFLTYDLGQKFRSRSWWKYLEYAGDGAVVAIFIHALSLGGELQISWFRAVWYFYGVILLAVLADIYYRKIKKGLPRTKS